MVTEAQVREAAEEAFGEWGWGWSTEALVIDDVSYEVEWVEKTENEERNMDLVAVFKINIDGWDRYFRKDGYNQSHVGETWDGELVEVVPEPVSRIDYVRGTTVEKLTAKEVDEAISSHDDLYWSELSWYLNKYTDSKININGRDYSIEILEEEDGGDREWSYDCWVVFRIGDQVFKKSGHYQSHYGTDWDAPLKEVKQVQKTVTVWEDA